MRGLSRLLLVKLRLDDREIWSSLPFTSSRPIGFCGSPSIYHWHRHRVEQRQGIFSGIFIIRLASQTDNAVWCSRWPCCVDDDKPDDGSTDLHSGKRPSRPTEILIRSSEGIKICSGIFWGSRPLRPRSEWRWMTWFCVGDPKWILQNYNTLMQNNGKRRKLINIWGSRSPNKERQWN